MARKICCVMLSLFIVCGGVLSRYNTVPVHAADALSAEVSTEMLMILWELLAGSMIVSGASEAVLDYDSEKELFTAFTEFLFVEMPGADWRENSYVLVDGQPVYYTDLFVDGTSALELPDEDTWQKFRVIDGGGSGDSEGSGDENQEEEPETPFTEVQAFVIGSVMLTEVASFIQSLWNGAVEGVDAADYYYVDAEGLPDYSFSGLEQVYQCRFYRGQYGNNGDTSWYELHGTATSEYPLVFVLNVGSYNCKVYKDGVLRFAGDYADISGVFTKNGVVTSEGSLNNVGISSSLPVYSMTAPMFNSEEAALAYLQNGDTSGIINADPYSYPALADTVPQVLDPYADAAIDPAALLDLYAALVAAAEAVPEPDAGTDPAANNAAYAQAMTEAVAIPDALPDTEEETAPGVVIDPAGEVTLDTYKVELTNIFPFCLPFDLIRLLEALDAEPEAPVFEFPFVVPALGIDEVYEFDMSWLDPVMEIWRMGEVIGFVIALIFATGKLIKW